MNKLLCFILIFLFAFPSFSQATGSSKYTTILFDIFDTDVQLMGYAESQSEFEQIAEELAAQLTIYHQLFDPYHLYDDVHNLCFVNLYAAHSPVQVPALLFSLLSDCQALWIENKNGANVAMGSVLSLWHAYRMQGLEEPNQAKLPPMEDLLQAAQHIDFSSVILDPEYNTVFFSDPKLQLDLGAVAKGYAADLIYSFLIEKMPSFLVSLGGNVICGESPMDGRAHWGVSVYDPNGTNNQSLDVLYVDRLSVVTSGDYARFYTVDGIVYHHIIDPATLMPSQHLRAVTVIAKSSFMADYLSTTLFLMPFNEGLSLIESLDEVEALWVIPSGDIHYSSGMDHYAKSLGASAQMR